MTPKRRILPVFVPHLGCPHDCVFCNQRKISGTATPVTAEDVVRAIENAPGTGYELAFYGGSFTAVEASVQNALLKAAQPYLQSGQLSAIRLSTRPDVVSPEILSRLKAHGVATVELGVQSLDDAVLKASGRGHTRAEAISGAQLVKASGLQLVLQMMTGLPEDTPERAMETASAIAALHPDGVRIYPTVVVRDTALYRLWQAGKYTPQSTTEAAELCAGLWELFDKAGIPVIRCGLNPTEALSGGEAAAGPYHAAFGQLVQSAKYRRKMEAQLSGCEGAAVTFAVSRGQLSTALGQKRENVRLLTGKYGLSGLKIQESDLSLGEIQRISVAK